MMLKSTRGGAAVPSYEAILRGIAPDGGLYVPESFPYLDYGTLMDKSYAERAAEVLSLYLDEFGYDWLLRAAEEAYSSFEGGAAPLSSVADTLEVMELWHGPTCAFKDMALQILPRLLPRAASLAGEKKDILILVATSGDTGKAALEGFCDVPGTHVVVFYPRDGVSDMQKLQMQTQRGDRVHCIAVRGDFDDAQTGVKRLFADKELAELLGEKGFMFSSANSINFGRLAPQIAYYFSAYCDMVEKGAVLGGEKVNFVVPSGNFGNILAGYYAKRMGLPVGKLICASNSNNVLTDFFATGVYDRKRPLHKTSSPSMDILVSSNLERLLYELAGRDSAKVGEWMAALSSGGKYDIGPLKETLDGEFWAAWADEDETASVIRSCYDETGYLLDPHTAVGYSVYYKYTAASCDETPTVLVSTANPFKFTADVLAALGVHIDDNGFAQANDLSITTGWAVPEPIASLSGLPVRHKEECERDDMKQALLSALGI